LTTTSENNKRIAKNTLMLYFRMILTMSVSLYTSRVVLNTLGIEDFGIYNVVAGVVILFSSINTTMATAVQRFMNYEIGQNNHTKLNNVFNTSLIVHIGIALIILILLETIGVWFLNCKMNISPERINAANWVLQFSIFSFAISILTVPYHAAIIANERMSAFAYIGIIEVSLKLLIVYLLTLFSFDKLKLYAVLTFCVTLLLQSIYTSYSKRHFQECKFRWLWDKKLYKEMMSFAGWNMIGVSSSIIRTQGINIVMNLFFGVFVNAAMGISNQVRNAVESFTNNFLIAINPQITKSYASGNFPYLMDLLFRGSKYAFFLTLILTLPLLLETEIVIKTWLKQVPKYSTIFIQLILITNLIEVLSKPLIQAMFATGKIKTYQLVVGSITILNLPITIIFFYLGYQPYVAFIIGIFIAIMALLIRLLMLRNMIGIKIGSFLKNVVLSVTSVGICSLTVPLILKIWLPINEFRFILIGCTSIFTTVISIYVIGLSYNEKQFIHKKIRNIIKL